MKKTIIICVLISLIPMATIGGGLFWAIKRHAVYKTYKKTKGEIMKLNTKREGKYDAAGETVYYPKITYTDDNNEVHAFELKTGSNPPIGRVGERVDLLVNPKNPEDVLVDTFFYKWFGPTVVFLIGFIVFTFVGIVSVRVIINERKSHEKH